MRVRSRLAVLAILGAGLGAMTPSALAAPCTRTWDGGAGTTAWGTDTNWDTNMLPGPADIVCLGAAEVVHGAGFHRGAGDPGRERAAPRHWWHALADLDDGAVAVPGCDLGRGRRAATRRAGDDRRCRARRRHPPRRRDGRTDGAKPQAPVRDHHGVGRPARGGAGPDPERARQVDGRSRDDRRRNARRPACRRTGGHPRRRVARLDAGRGRVAQRTAHAERPRHAADRPADHHHRGGGRPVRHGGPDLRHRVGGVRAAGPDRRRRQPLRRNACRLGAERSSQVDG